MRRTPKSIRFHLLFLPLAALLAGCATTHNFEVDAYVSDNSGPAPVSYRLVDAAAGAPESAVSFAEVADDVGTALSSQGLHEAKPGATPSIVVTIEYGLEPPRLVVRKIRETVYLPSVGGPNRSGSGLGGSAAAAGPSGFGPGGGLQVQHRTIQGTETIHPVFLRLTARDEPTQAQIWMIEVRSEDEFPDLQECLRLMAEAAIDYLGTYVPESNHISIAGSASRTGLTAQGT